MTTAEADDLIAAEQRKLDALRKIVAILEELDGEQQEWILEKLNE